MTISKTNDAGGLTITVEGRLDTITSPELQGVLLPELQTNRQVVLDFSNLVYVSSAGLRVILLGQKTATARGGKMILKNVSSDVMEVFRMTGFESILNFQ